MEPIISYIDALSIEKVYFIALSICLFLSIKIKKVFHLALITLTFSAVSQLFLFDYLYNKGVEYWVIGWCMYELLLIGSIITFRLISSNINNRFILSDILLIIGSVVQISVYLLTYIVKGTGSSAMDLIYAATGPTLYVITIVILAFPFIYNIMYNLKGNKELIGDKFNRDRSNTRGIFSARVHSLIVGS